MARIAFIGSLTGSEPAGTTYLDGVRLAARDVADRPVRLSISVIDDLGDAARASSSLVTAASRSEAVIFAGPGSAVTAVRPELEQAGTPVFLLEGDLYSSRGLFREVFQASIPLLWQARAIARYVGASPGRPATVVLDDTDRRAAEAAWRQASAERGITAAPVVSDALPEGPSGQVVASDAFLSAATPGSLAAGTAAVGTYAWSGWAEPIPRVRAFRDRFREAYGRLPLGHEQEGYDALRVAELALRHTGGRGGASLIAELERFRAVTSSSLPIRLGPDDHTFVDQLEVGLFAVPGPGERVELWVVPEAPWRPVMRTFTFDGKKTSILERDRGPFFPAWHPPAPSPYYWRSRLGITTGPDDPLH